MRLYWSYTLTTMVLFFSAWNVYADDYQSIDQIEQVAYEYAIAKASTSFDNPQIIMGELDPRLRLSSCSMPLELINNSVNNKLGKQTIAISCPAPITWTVYLPLQIKVFKQVVVATRPLSAKTLITAGDVKLQSWDVSNLRQGYLSELQQIIGQELKYPVAMGRAIKAKAVQAQKIVHRGEHIMLVATLGEMEVRMGGIAMSDASIGQRVRVKNSSSKRIVEGIVDGPGIVKVLM